MPDPERSPSEPPTTVMSVFTKSDVASLDLNVSERVVSLPVPPSFISACMSEAVIVIVGAVVSGVNQAAVGVTFQLVVVLNLEIIAVAPSNIKSKLDTLLTSQARMSWAKLVAPLNMPLIYLTAPI